jgi:hypothetical protein
VITGLELALMLRSADRDEQLDALVSLIDRGLVTAVIDRDSIVAITTTDEGDAALKARTLPTAQS